MKKFLLLAIVLVVVMSVVLQVMILNKDKETANEPVAASTITPSQQQVQDQSVVLEKRAEPEQGTVSNMQAQDKKEEIIHEQPIHDAILPY